MVDGGQRPGPRLVAKHSGEKMEVDGIISTGFCGALDPALRVGDIVVSGDVPSAPALSAREICSSDRVAVTAAEKRALAREDRRDRRGNGSGRGARKPRNGACRFVVFGRFPIPRRKTCRWISICIATRRDVFAAPHRAGGAAPSFHAHTGAATLGSQLPHAAAETLGEFFADCRF